MTRVADRVKDTTTSTGTTAIVLSGSAPAGYRTFAQGFGSSPCSVRYTIQGQTPGEYEVGIGTFNGTTGLTRDIVETSSNGNALVNFSAGIKDVFCSVTAEHINTSTIGFNYVMARGFALP